MRNRKQKYKLPAISARISLYSGFCLLLLLSTARAEAQELRAGLEYRGWITKDLFIEPGVESRYFSPYSARPDHLLFSLSAGYRFDNHWKLKAGFRYRNGTEEREEIFSGLDDKIRYTADAFYCTANRKKSRKFQVRLRYQLSQEQDDLDDYYRLRLKWKYTSTKGFTPFLSTELIYSELEVIPHSIRFRAGIDIRTTPTTDLSIFYQAEARLKKNHNMSHYVIGCSLNLHAR